MSMAVIGSNINPVNYAINKSLRFRSSASAYLSRIPTSAGNRKTWTWSSWIKRGVLSTAGNIFTSPYSAADNFLFRFLGDDTLQVANTTSSTATLNLITTQVFRDSSAWYHIVLSIDTTQSTSSNRASLYVNGNKVSAFSTLIYPSLNADLNINQTNAHNISNLSGVTQCFDGYMTEINFIDGQALTPSSFGMYNSGLGNVWQPMKYTGSYGTNGFYLPFTDNSSVIALGYDQKPGTVSRLTSSTTYTVPTYSSSLVVEMWGGGGGGGGGGATYGNNGGAGTSSTFAAPGGTLTAGGGSGGTGVYRTDLGSPSGTGVSGSGGTASGGDVNTNGNSIATTNTYTTGAGAPNGGGNTTTAHNNAEAFIGTYPGGAGSGGVYLGPSQPTGGAGGSGAYVKKTYSVGQLTPGSSISVTVGAAGAGGIADAQSGAGGAAGLVRITVDGVVVNDWNPINVSLTAGATYDSMTDVPTLTGPSVGNYCVINPIGSYFGGQSTLTNGNLYYQSPNPSSNYAVSGIMGTIGFPSGSFYWEATITLTPGANGGYPIGVVDSAATLNSGAGFDNGYFWSYNILTGQILVNGSAVATVASSTLNDVLGFAFDRTNGQMRIYKNGSLLTTQTGTPSGNGKSWIPAAAIDQGFNNDRKISLQFNFGQRPFAYTLPAGYLPLNTYNLPNPSIIQGNKYMDATLFTGNTSGGTVTNAGGFKPDFVWNKTRDVVQNHFLIDSVRGGDKLLYINLTNAEATNAQLITSFNSNGFTYGNALASANSYVSWQWQAGQGTTSTNTKGTITSTVSVNASAGFSIVSYTGNATAGATVGHGLGVAPAFIIAKARGQVTSWPVYHQSLGASKYILINGTDAAVSSTQEWGGVAPTSSVITIGNSSANNNQSVANIIYAFSQIAGYSAFGSYVGNGVSTGPFIYCGFQPRWILIRSTTASRSWCIWDTARNPYNLGTAGTLFTESSSAEYSGAGAYTVAVTSNGFYLPVSTTNLNGTSETMLYAAFAENPFKVALAR